MDYLVQHHLAPGDSSQNDVEHAKSFVADAMCN